MAMVTTYKKGKTEGEWVLRITGEYPQEGQAVEVTTKGGKTRTEVVKKIFWQGPDKFKPDEYIFLCSIDKSPVPGANGKQQGQQPSAVPPAPPPPPPKQVKPQVEEPHFPPKESEPVESDKHFESGQDGMLVSEGELEQTHASLNTKELGHDDDMPF